MSTTNYTKVDVESKYNNLKTKHDEFVSIYKEFIDNNKKYLNTTPTYFLNSNLDINSLSAVYTSSLIFPSNVSS
jgi:hypothetical protein